VGADRRKPHVAIAAYALAELAGSDPEHAVPGMAAHLAGCPACREEHESLREIAAGEG
jgi:hypothetical protein